MSRNGTTSNAVSLARPPGFYASDNELVDELAAEIGIFAFGVYHLLLRKAWQNGGARVSLRDIEDALGISRVSARNAIDTLKNAHLIEEKPSRNNNEPPLYLIVFAKDVIATRRTNPQDAQDCSKSRTRVKTKRVLKIEQGVFQNQDAPVLESSHTRSISRTPNKEENKNKNKSKNNTTPTPLSGGEERAVGVVDPNDTRTPGERKLAEILAKHGEQTPAAEPVAAKADVQAAVADSPRAHRLVEARVNFHAVMAPIRLALQTTSLSLGDRRPAHLKDGFDEWNKYFEQVSIVDVESAEGSQDGVVLVLEADDVRTAREGFVKYSGRVAKEMQKVFGRQVGIVWRSRGEVAA